MSSLSERLRPNVEAAPWVVDAVRKLEYERDAAVAKLSGRDALWAEMIDTLLHALCEIGEYVTDWHDADWRDMIAHISSVAKSADPPPNTGLSCARRDSSDMSAQDGDT